MRTGKADRTYTVLAFDQDLNITECDGPDLMIDQFEGDILEVWKERDDGFLFVYCKRLEIGYWVTPEHIALDA